MTAGISRRDALCGFGHAAAFGALAIALPRHFAAAQDATGGEAGVCLSMVYLNTTAALVKFDADRWRDSHLAMLQSVYGDSIERAELRVAPRGRSGRAERAPLAAGVSIWIRDMSEFGKRTTASSEQILADLGQITDGQPVVQYDRTVATQGDRREAVPVGSNCLSTYFPLRDGARWDSRYYTVDYLPKLSALLGYKAMRRIEVSEGITQGEAKPAVVSTTHVYVRDQREFDQVLRRSAAQVMLDEAPNYTDIRPVSGMMVVHAIG